MARKRPTKAANTVVRRQLAKEKARRRAFMAAAVAVVLLIVAGIGGWYVYQSQRPEPAAGGFPAGADATGVRVGTGPVTVDVYLDYMCPHCKEFEEKTADTLAGLVRDGKATVVYHPLAFLDDASSTRYSTRSAAASGCAADAGKFVEYTAELYAVQPREGGPGLSDETLTELAGKAGADTGAFGRCMRADKHVGWVDGLTERAVKRGVKGTPTVLVNGKTVNSDPEAITAAVASAQR